MNIELKLVVYYIAPRKRTLIFCTVIIAIVEKKNIANKRMLFSSTPKERKNLEKKKEKV